MIRTCFLPIIHVCRWYLLGQFLLLQPDREHVRQRFTALLVEDVIHERRALRQHFEAERDALHVVVCDWLLGQRGLAQVQHRDHDEHGFSNEGLQIDNTNSVESKPTRTQQRGQNVVYVTFLVLNVCV